MKDSNNQYEVLEEVDSIGTYKGFKESWSITAWHTSASKASVESMNQNAVPLDVVVDQENNSQPSEASSQISNNSPTARTSPVTS